MCPRTPNVPQNYPTAPQNSPIYPCGTPSSQASGKCGRWPTPQAPQQYPELVRGLVREHAGRASAILVAVVTCKEDLDTQVGDVC